MEIKSDKIEMAMKLRTTVISLYWRAVSVIWYKLLMLNVETTEERCIYKTIVQHQIGRKNTQLIHGENLVQINKHKN